MDPPRLSSNDGALEQQLCRAIKSYRTPAAAREALLARAGHMAALSASAGNHWLGTLLSYKGLAAAGLIAATVGGLLFIGSMFRDDKPHARESDAHGEPGARIEVGPSEPAARGLADEFGPSAAPSPKPKPDTAALAMEQNRAARSSAPGAAEPSRVGAGQPPPRAARKPAPPRSHTETTDTLEQEVSLLEAVRMALARGHARRALRQLRSYRRRFSKGRLTLEARVLRVEALAKAGRTKEASRLADAFLNKHPNSLLAARVRPFASPADRP